MTSRRGREQVPNLAIQIDPALASALSHAIAKRKAIRVALYGPLSSDGNVLSVSPFDLPALLELTEKVLETEFRLFRLRQVARTKLQDRLKLARRPETKRAYEDALDYLSKSEVGMLATRQ